MGAISSQPSRWMFVLALCAALGFADPPAETKLTASDGAAGDQFGFAAASDGDTVVVAALLDDDAGSAYVFVRSGTVWTEQAKLVRERRCAK